MLPYLVMLAELATFVVMCLYGAVMLSMHIEAKACGDHPRLDPVGRALTRAARYAFYTGTGAVILISLFGGLLKWPTLS